MSTALVSPDDLIASVEKHLVDNWPWAMTEVEWFGVGRVAPDTWTGTAAPVRVSSQWIAITRTRQTRASESEYDFDLRLIVTSKSDQTLHATGIAGDLQQIMDESLVDLYQRITSTVYGFVKVEQTEVTPEQKDQRDQRVAVLEVTGWARTPA